MQNSIKHLQIMANSCALGMHNSSNGKDVFYCLLTFMDIFSHYHLMNVIL